MSEPAGPTHVAVSWLRATREATWATRAPTGWIDRARPYVTDELHQENEALRDGGGGADWATFVQRRCTSVLADPAAIIPPEAPGTDTVVNVQVSGTVTTSCAAGEPIAPTEFAAATVVVVRTALGWRVAKRLF